MQVIEEKETFASVAIAIKSFKETKLSQNPTTYAEEELLLTTPFIKKSRDFL